MTVALSSALHTRAVPLNILGSGLFVPPQVETAAALAPRIGRSADWIRQRTGVAERRVSTLPMEQMAARAVRAAVADGPAPDLLVNASITPVQLIPDSSVFILEALGMSGVPGMSIHASCLSFLAALPVVAGLLATGVHERIVVVSAERGTAARNPDEPESAALLGDGAAAVVFGGADHGGGHLLGWASGTWPAGAPHAQIPGFGLRHHPSHPGTTPQHAMFSMNGPRMFKLALRHVLSTVGGLLSGLGLAPDDIDLVVPHQASGPGLRLLPRMGFPPERVVDVVGRWGNCIAASIPMALAHARAEGRVGPGSRVLLVGTGAGLSVSAAVLEC